MADANFPATIPRRHSARTIVAPSSIGIGESARTQRLSDRQYLFEDNMADEAFERVPAGAREPELLHESAPAPGS